MKALFLRRAVATAVCFLFAFSFAHIAQAQPFQAEACEPDCFNDKFTPLGVLPPVMVEVPGQPGCFLEISYGYRFACNTWHDFFIYKVTPFGNGCDPAFISDPNALIQTATTLLLLSNPPTDPAGTTVGPTKPTNPGDVNCVTNWRVLKGTCWKDYGGFSGACEVSPDCCLKPYTVCRDFCDNVTVTGSPSSAAGTPCGEDPSCIQVCD